MYVYVYALVGRSVGRMVRLVCVFGVTCALCHLNGIAHTLRHRKRFIKLRQRKLYMCSVKVSLHETKSGRHATYVWHMENQICPFNTLWRLVHFIFSLVSFDPIHDLSNTHTLAHRRFLFTLQVRPQHADSRSYCVFACSFEFLLDYYQWYWFFVRQKLYFSRTKSICNVVQNKWWVG